MTNDERFEQWLTSDEDAPEPTDEEFVAMRRAFRAGLESERNRVREIASNLEFECGALRAEFPKAEHVADRIFDLLKELRDDE